jgi:hypothetical protein
MSPRLLFLLSSHHALARRDEIDAELAAARMPHGPRHLRTRP